MFASPTETQGLVLIEAMALGVPSVSTAVMGTATVLRDARSALVSHDDVEAFATQVTRVQHDHALRESLAAAGPKDAYAWRMDVLMPRLIDIYTRPRPSNHRQVGSPVRSS